LNSGLGSQSLQRLVRFQRVDFVSAIFQAVGIFLACARDLVALEVDAYQTPPNDKIAKGDILRPGFSKKERAGQHTAG
jgi:hypothetical protein